MPNTQIDCRSTIRIIIIIAAARCARVLIKPIPSRSCSKSDSHARRSPHQMTLIKRNKTRSRPAPPPTTTTIKHFRRAAQSAPLTPITARSISSFVGTTRAVLIAVRSSAVGSVVVGNMLIILRPQHPKLIYNGTRNRCWVGGNRVVRAITGWRMTPRLCALLGA